ncbi:hypothetical protein LLE49_20150 [Alicyclobacillus tolerans]|uniref:hypothetical protein n=1 Tax=Alicyclobacillus tolerans TaxID=90970 RepID=UPI001F252BCB|nr:hypothetical protein [Alicyclobacillus tolerans]MCF8567037.1 hypothetical protein [Alicyclobacillus tolerans]
MNTYVLPWLHFVLLLLTAAAGGFAMVQLSLAGIGVIATSPQRKADALGRVKWIVLGTVVALSTYFLAHMIGYEASLMLPRSSSANTPTVNFGQQPIPTLPGYNNNSGLGGWVESMVFSSLADILSLFAMVFWALTGFTGPSAMVRLNIQTSSNGDVMGIFAPQTWSAMMYVQHSLYFLIGVAALISFVLQGIQIQNAPSSAVAKERTVALLKSVLLTGLLMGLTPYLLGLANAGVSDLTQYILQLMKVHTSQLAQNTMLDTLFGQSPGTASMYTKIKLLSGASVANSLFDLIYSIVNFATWVVYQWRRVVLGLLITLMPLFYIGLVTGKKPDLAVHWWKEVVAYLLIPFVASLFLLVAQVFIGI